MKLLTDIIDKQNATISFLLPELDTYRSPSDTQTTAVLLEPGTSLTIDRAVTLHAACIDKVMEQIKPLLAETWKDTKVLISDASGANMAHTTSTLVEMTSGLVDCSAGLFKKIMDKSKARFDVVEHRLAALEKIALPVSFLFRGWCYTACRRSH